MFLKETKRYQKGIFFLRFFGKVGEIIGNQGTCYKVRIKDGNKLKVCVVHPVHLVRV